MNEIYEEFVNFIISESDINYISSSGKKIRDQLKFISCSFYKNAVIFLTIGQMNKKDVIFSDMFIFSFRRHNNKVLTTEQLINIAGISLIFNHNK